MPNFHIARTLNFFKRIPNKRPFKNKSPFEFQFTIKKEVSGMLKEIDIHLIDLIKEVQNTCNI
jgi:hypothetical protein